MNLDPERLQRLIDDMPIEYRERYLELLDGSHPAPAMARQRLDAYLTMVREVSEWVTALDPRAAEKIGASCAALLDTTPKTDMPFVTALALYFVEEDDDDEVTGVLGFDDDVQVLNAVCRLLDRPELLVRL